MCEGLLAAIDREHDASLRSSICDIAGELAGYVLEENQWPEIITFAYKNLQVSIVERQTFLCPLMMFIVK